MGSKYTVEETTDGFVVRGKDRVPVRVKLWPTCLEICKEGNNKSTQLGFYEYYLLSRGIAETLMANWEPPDAGRKPFPGLRNWVTKQTAKAIGKRVHAQWKRLLSKVDPTVLAVHRAMFAATMMAGALAMDESLYRHRYIVSDILNYRAAAIAAVNTFYLARDYARRKTLNSPVATEINQQLAALKKLAAEHGMELIHNLADHTLTPDPIEAMQNWRSLFSYNGEPYRSLDRTLMNLPGGIPHGLLCDLSHWQLERPYTDRVELLTLLFACNTHNQSGRNLRVFEFARRPQILEAMQRVAAHTHNDLSTRRSRDIRFVVNFLQDFPDEHNGNIVGLADKSIRWHRDQREAEIERQLDRLGADTKTAKPPVLLPDMPDVRFLETVADVCEEGREMEHCIASYAWQAVRGHSFLFHVEHDGASATVEVGPTGRVLQAHGPRNRRNKAAAWGQRTLARWGAQFPADNNGRQAVAEGEAQKVAKSMLRDRLNGLVDLVAQAAVVPGEAHEDEAGARQAIVDGYRQAVWDAICDAHRAAGTGKANAGFTDLRVADAWVVYHIAVNLAIGHLDTEALPDRARLSADEQALLADAGIRLVDCAGIVMPG